MTMPGPEFEQQVRIIARNLWQLNPGSGSAEFIGGEEIDCVCKTEDLVHLIECTQQRTMQKFRDQSNKLVASKRFLEGKGETVKLWIVTEHEPTPDQLRSAKSSGITALAFPEFSRRLVDSHAYLEARWNCAFGSALDPETGQSNLPEDEYVDLPISSRDGNIDYSVRGLADMLVSGESIMLQGPFGAGKSLTVREIFRDLRRRHYRNPASPMPMAINLRDHWGQTDVDEVIRRHARRCGFEKPDELIRAWNAGRVIAMLDGLDELASPAFPAGRDAIRRSRQQALNAVRSFVADSKGRSGILLAGRDHYFDSIEEAKRILSLPNGMNFVEIGEFTEDQAMAYLSTKKVDEALPQWLPRKPLLLGYLASQNLLQEVLSIDGDSGSAYAWDKFLDRISEREAELNFDIDKDVVRSLLEALANRSRELSSGTGPLFETDLANAFEKGTGLEPSESSRVLLGRLPGLTAREQEMGARSFVDEEMLQALRAGTVARFIQNPFEQINFAPWQHSLDEFGCSVAAMLAERSGMKTANHRVAANEAIQRWQEPTLAFDCLLSSGNDPESEILDGSGMVVKSGYCDVIDLVDSKLENIAFESCLINHVRFDPGQDLPLSFRGCLIAQVEGVANLTELPVQFENCDIEEFDATRTNAAIMHSNLVPPVRVLLTIIRKLFLQRGSGRVQQALSRGLDERFSTYVGPILQQLESASIIFSHPATRGLIWHGNRSERARMLQILEKPTTSDDVLLEAVSKLT